MANSDWEKGMLIFRAITPLHVGSGTSVSYVDLPIARERHTNYPIIPGSGIKGVFREAAGRLNARKVEECSVEEIFGPEAGSSDLGASAIAFTDAKILLYPVRSLRGTFALITSPLVLKRLAYELESFGLEDGSLKNAIKTLEDINPSDTQIIVGSNSALKISKGDKEYVILEEFSFVAKSSDSIDTLAEKLSEISSEMLNKSLLKKHTAVVSDNVFSDFVRYATEIRTRIRIDQATGTVAEGALFSMEMVPAEAVFYSFVFGRNRKDNEGKKAIKCVRSILQNSKVLQVGGDETVGMGFVEINIYPKEGKDGNQES